MVENMEVAMFSKKLPATVFFPVRMTKTPQLTNT
jgi:hypothetical protein